jgi:hypothetical protein
LRTFHITDNLLTEIPDMCAYAQTLKSLFLNGNKLITINSSRLQCLVKLTHLYMRDLDCDFDALDFGPSFSSLEHLNMAGNDMTTLPVIHNVTGLQHFDLSYCSNLVIPSDYFVGRNFSSLQQLHFTNGGDINGLDFSDIGDTLELIVLPPSAARLEVASFASLAKLKVLHASSIASSFIPTMCHSDVSVNAIGSAVDLCAPENFWLKMVQDLKVVGDPRYYMEEPGGDVYIDDRYCGSKSWDMSTTQELLDQLEQNTPPGTFISYLS